MQGVWAGMVAGAAGTAALNAVSYGDMLARGRAASDVPARTAEALAAKAGVRFGTGAPSDARREAAGALLGYAAGIGVGALYGLVRPRWRAPLALAGLALGGAAMLAGDVPPIASRVTDPRTWGATGWIGDAVPHLAYGLVAAAVFEAIAPRARARRRWRAR
jgi:xanthosine utilization system XapX-like protein